MGLDELENMSRIIGKALFHQLAMVEAIDKDTNSPFQCLGTTGKAA